MTTMNPETRQRRTEDIRRRQQSTVTMWSNCRIPGCGRPTVSKEGKGLNERYCRRHATHYQRHGDPVMGSFKAAVLNPYRRAAFDWLTKHQDSLWVKNAHLRVRSLCGRSGRADVEASRVVGKSARERADAVWGRLRVAGVDTRLPMSAWLAVEMAMEDDPTIAPHRYEYRNVQAAKVVHRMASGTHRVWQRPQAVRKGTPERPLWPEEQRRSPEVVALHVYPESRGRVLRHVGADLERAVELLAGHRLGDVRAFMADLEATGKLRKDPYPGLGVPVRRRPKGVAEEGRLSCV